MTKKRPSIPKGVEDKVKKEFSHSCGYCDANDPQLHHIDEDPSNNDPLNLIPLCPSCHMNIQHNPFKKADNRVLTLFRKYKKQGLLSSQFELFHEKLTFLDELENLEIDDIEKFSIDLVEFVETLEQGKYYSKKISEIVIQEEISILDVIDSQVDAKDQEHKTTLQNRKEDILRLVVDLVQLQPWKSKFES